MQAVCAPHNAAHGAQVSVFIVLLLDDKLVPRVLARRRISHVEQKTVAFRILTRKEGNHLLEEIRMYHQTPLGIERAPEPPDLTRLHTAAHQAKRHRIRLQFVAEQDSAEFLQEKLDALILIICFRNIRLILPHCLYPLLAIPY